MESWFLERSIEWMAESGLMERASAMSLNIPGADSESTVSALIASSELSSDCNYNAANKAGMGDPIETNGKPN